MRLDLYLKNNCGIQSRNKAAELIKAKKVLVNGVLILKSSYIVGEEDRVNIQEDQFFVSRAAYKLKYFLEEYNIDIKNSDALDIGSSTGGFTQILLQNNIKSITCVDVGSNQLHKILRDDKRIIVKENTDIRKFYPSKSYDLITCDVSFISILTILNDIDRLAAQKIIILYKPQFEVGKNIKRDSKGVVKDAVVIKKQRDLFLRQTKELKWTLQYSSISKLSGKQGNVEELFYFISSSKPL